MPTRPCFQPWITGSLPSVKLNGEPLSHDASNCVPPLNSTPTYCIDSLSPFFAALPLPTTMSFTTSFFGGAPVCFGTTGFDFVSFRFVDALGAAGAAGAGAAGISAGLVASDPPQPATAMAAPASSAGRWVRLITARQASEPRT